MAYLNNYNTIILIVYLVKMDFVHVRIHLINYIEIIKLVAKDVHIRTLLVHFV